MKNPTLKLSRRTLLGAAVPALAVAQAPPAQPSPDKPDYLAISAAQNRRNAEALGNVPVAIETEPSFHFEP